MNILYTSSSSKLHKFADRYQCSPVPPGLHKALEVKRHRTEQRHKCQPLSD